MHIHMRPGPSLHLVYKTDPALGRNECWIANGEVICKSLAPFVADVRRREMNEARDREV